MAFPALDALKDRYEVYPVVDAVGGTSVIAHEVALRRMEQEGAKLISTSQLACELQRDWAGMERLILWCRRCKLQELSLMYSPRG